MRSLTFPQNDRRLFGPTSACDSRVPPASGGGKEPGEFDGKGRKRPPDPGRVEGWRDAGETSNIVAKYGAEGPVSRGWGVRVGIGHDTHRLVEGRALILAGVRIETPGGVCLGHSDADVVMHAVADALLGAAALGDNGEWYPDTDPRFAGIDGAALLGDVVARVARAGWSPVNCDVVIHAQSPKLSPYKEGMRRNLAGVLGLELGAVNVKAKTGELVGPVGRHEAIACEAAVLPEGGCFPDGGVRSSEPDPRHETKPTPMPLRVYNTLSQTKEPFQTVQPGKVGMYVCGPTVYSPSHIGHMVGPVIFDTISRYLTSTLGYEL